MATFENSGHSYTESGHYEETEEKKMGTIFNLFETTEALEALLSLHKREMTDNTITVNDWKNAIKKGEEALQKFNNRMET